MRMAIHSKNRVSDKLRDSIERRLRFVLGRFGGRVRRVTVHLTDVHKAHAKATKRCRIVVELLPIGSVTVEDTDADSQTVADRATGRVGQSVERAIERRHAGKAGAAPAA